MKNKNDYQRLLDKSKEAFIMGIEIYNKPTIKYRIEGFSFFICNAWELMLKAYLIKSRGEKSIYYKDKPNRTISLNECIRKIFTNKKDPLRKNLENIIELRNTSTHFITEDYETIYAPLFQANVINFLAKSSEFHNVDFSDSISTNFLNLHLTINNLTDSEIHAKYTDNVANKIIVSRNSIANETLTEKNNNFAIPVQTNFYITKKKKDADIIVNVDNSSDTAVQIVKEMKDPNSTYPYRTKDVITMVNKFLQTKNIKLTKYHKDGSTNIGSFNQNDFLMFVKFYGLKQNKKFAFYYENANLYSYSQQTTDFIINEISRDPDRIMRKLKLGLNKNNKTK